MTFSRSDRMFIFPCFEWLRLRLRLCVSMFAHHTLAPGISLNNLSSSLPFRELIYLFVCSMPFVSECTTTTPCVWVCTLGSLCLAFWLPACPSVHCSVFTMNGLFTTVLCGLWNDKFTIMNLRFFLLLSPFWCAHYICLLIFYFFLFLFLFFLTFFNLVCHLGFRLQALVNYYYLVTRLAAGFHLWK